MRYACTMEYYPALKVKGTCNVDELWGHNALWNKPVTKGQILWFHLVLKFIKIGKGMVAARHYREGEMGGY